MGPMVQPCFGLPGWHRRLEHRSTTENSCLVSLVGSVTRFPYNGRFGRSPEVILVTVSPHDHVITQMRTWVPDFGNPMLTLSLPI